MRRTNCRACVGGCTAQLRLTRRRRKRPDGIEGVALSGRPAAAGAGRDGDGNRSARREDRDYRHRRAASLQFPLLTPPCQELAELLR